MSEPDPELRRNYPQPPQQVRQHRLSSRAKRQRRPRRPARLQRHLLAGVDLRHGKAALLARSQNATPSLLAPPSGCGARIPDVRALLSAFSARPPRQHPDLGSPGRSSGPQNRRLRYRNSNCRRLDADLLRPRSRRPSRERPTAGGNSRRLVVRVSPIPKLEIPRFDPGFFSSRWTDLRPKTRLPAEPRDVAASLSLHGPAGAEAQHYHGI